MLNDTEVKVTALNSNSEEATDTEKKTHWNDWRNSMLDRAQNERDHCEGLQHLPANVVPCATRQVGRYHGWNLLHKELAWWHGGKVHRRVRSNTRYTKVMQVCPFVDRLQQGCRQMLVHVPYRNNQKVFSSCNQTFFKLSQGGFMIKHQIHHAWKTRTIVQGTWPVPM